MIRPHDLVKMPGTGIFLRNLLRFDWLECSTNSPFRCATDLVGEAHEEAMYLENYLNCLLSKRGLNSARRSLSTSGQFTMGISVIV